MSEAETIVDNDYATLWYHPDTKVVHHRIKSFLVPGALEKLLSAGADLMERHGTRKWLSDDSKNIVISPEDIAWADEVWYPRVRRAGFRYWAVVVPEKKVAALQMKHLQAKRRGDGITVELFESVEEAQAWLGPL